MDESIFIVHNGIIENFEPLKTFLSSHNYTFESETDTEVIANLLQYYQDQDKSISFEKIIQKVIQNIVGTFAFIIYNTHYPMSIFCVRRGSPLLMTYDSNNVMISSEQAGFDHKMGFYIVLDNDDICRADYSEMNITVHCKSNYQPHKLSSEIFVHSPAPFEHWTLKEIHEQSQTILNALNRGGRIRDDRIHLGGLEPHIQFFKNLDHIILLGCGTSYHSCLTAQFFFKKYCNVCTVTVYDGGSFSAQDIPKKGVSVAVVVSQSGETRDLYNA